MTYSIVARDPGVRGDLGVAVQTCWFGVGSGVPWAMAGVGAVATQSFSEERYGPLGLALMRGGLSADEALRALVASDDDEALRQVGFVDARGRASGHTGARCVAEAGHLAAQDVSVQANMMERPTVWGAMLEAFGSADGDLADRLITALHAAEAEGGDMRGRQSAALLVVPGDGPWWQRSVDLRVDDHPDPLAELTRLRNVQLAYRHLGDAGDLAAAGDLMAAAAENERAESLLPRDPQVAFWSGTTLAGSGRMTEAQERFAEAREANPRFARYLRRVAAAGILPDDAALLDALMPLDPSDGSRGEGHSG